METQITQLNPGEFQKYQSELADTNTGILMTKGRELIETLALLILSIQAVFPPQIIEKKYYEEYADSTLERLLKEIEIDPMQTNSI